MDNKNKYRSLLLAIFLFHLTVNYQILHRSQIPRIYDEGARIYYGIVFFHEFLSAPNINIMGLVKRGLSLSGYQFHPQLFDVLESFCFKVLDLFNALDVDLMILVINSFFLLILLISIYKIGSIIYNRNTGLLSAVLLPLFPLVFGHSRVAMLDYPLMCTVSLAIYFLLATKHFQSVYYSIITGVSCGLAQLTKESAILFIAPAFLYYCIQSFISGHKKKSIINSILTVLFFVAISGLVYLKKENILAFKVYYGKINYIPHRPDLFYYAKDFINGIGPFILWLSLPLMFSYLVHLRKREKLLFVWFFVPLILFSLSSNKSLRFLLPAFPAFGLIVMGEIASANWSRLFRLGYTVSILAVALFQYYLLNTGLLRLVGYDLTMEGGVLSAQKDKYASARASLLNILEQEYNQAVKENRVQRKTVLCLFLIGEIRWPLFTYMLLHQLPYWIDNYTEFDQADMVNFEFRKACWDETIQSADYIVDTSGNRNIPDYARFVDDEQRRVFYENIDRFEVIGSFPVFDGTSIFVYKRKN